MRPPPSPSDWPRDDVDDRDARLPQDELQAPRHWDLSAAASALPPPAAAACHAEAHRVNDGPRYLTSAAPAPPDSGPGGHGQAISRDEPFQSHDAQDCGCDASSASSASSSSSYDSDSNSSDDPAHCLQHLSVPSDHDLDISDSDGGAPLGDILSATAFSLNPDSDSGGDLDGSDVQDWYTDADDDNDQPPHSTALYPSTHQDNSQHTLIMDDEPPAPPWANVPPTPLPAGNVPHQEPVQGFAPQPPFFDNFADAFPPVQLSNPNPTILGSENLGLVDFLGDWAHESCFTSGTRPPPPHLYPLYRQVGAAAQDVTYAHLRGDECDLQGLDWTSMQTTRDDVRIRRRHTYKNYVNRRGSDKCVSGNGPVPRRRRE